MASLSLRLKDCWSLAFSLLNYNKIEIAARLQKSQNLPKCILFLPFDRCNMILPCYLHSIYIVQIIYRLWRWYFLIYLKFQCSKIRICQNWTNLVKNLHKNEFFRICRIWFLQLWERSSLILGGFTKLFELGQFPSQLWHLTTDMNTYWPPALLWLGCFTSLQFQELCQTMSETKESSLRRSSIVVNVRADGCLQMFTLVVHKSLLLCEGRGLC